MRIFHIFDHSIPLHSGYTFRSIALLREQRALGWETCHLTSPKQGTVKTEFEEIDGLRFYRSRVPTVNMPIIYELQQMRIVRERLKALVDELRPDIIHAHSPVLNAIPAISIGNRMGIPVVYEIRAFWEDAAVDHGTTTEGSLRYRLTRALETSALRRVDHVFTICEGLRTDILGRGIPETKVTVIPNAVDVKSFQLSGAADADLKHVLGLEGATVIGFVGSYYAYEGLDMLVEALPKLLACYPNLRLLLVGGGPQQNNLKAQAERIGVSKKVVFAGRVPHNEVSRYYDQIDLLVYPRHSMRLTELVTPLKPLEAMAQGRVFVASNVGGHRELVKDGETGKLFRADDINAMIAAISQMLDTRESWPQIRAAGRNFVENIRNWKNSVAKYHTPYSEIVANRKYLAV